MKKIKGLLVFASVCAMTAPVHAQVFGIPVGRDAAPGMAGEMRASANITIGDNLNLYGGRFAFNVLDEAFVFGDLGIVDPDRGDNGFGLQAGGQFTLPLQLDVPLDFAVRGTLGYASLDQKEQGVDVDIDIISLSAAGVISHTIDEMFSVYGVLGLAYARTEFSASVEGFSVSSTDSDTEIMIGGGATVNLNPQFGLYGDLLIVDDPWITIGGTFRF